MGRMAQGEKGGGGERDAKHRHRLAIRLPSSRPRAASYTTVIVATRLNREGGRGRRPGRAKLAFSFSNDLT